MNKLFIALIYLCITLFSSFACAFEIDKKLDCKYINITTQKNALCNTEKGANTKVSKIDYKNISSVNVINKNGSATSLLGKQPPPGFVYLTFLIALVGVLTNFIGFIVKRIDRTIDRLYSIKQDYWTKTFLVPVCLEPLRDFVLKNSDDINKLSISYYNNSTNIKKIGYSKYEKEFRENKSKLISYFMIINTFDSKVYLSITDKIDELEDIITKHCYANSNDIDDKSEYYHFRLCDIAISHLFITLSDILMIISENHNKLFSNRKTIRQFIFNG